MIGSLLKKINIFASLLLLVFIFGLVVFSCHVEIKDMDIWLHIATGRYILQNHVIPKVDILSDTIAGKPWINHEWLFQVIVAYIWDHYNADGLIWMQTIIVLLTFIFLIMLGLDEKRNLAQFFVLLLVVLVFRLRLTHRPDLFSMLFFAIDIFLLSFFIKKKITLFLLFVIQVLWVNMHGFFIFGPLLIGVGIVSEAIKRKIPLPFEWNKINRLEDLEFKRLIIAFWVVLAACLINPYFLEGLWYPFKVFFSVGGSSKIFFQMIQELQAPINLKTIFNIHTYPYYKVLIIFTFFSFLLNFKKIDIFGLFLWIIFLIFSLKAIRNIAFFGLAAYVIFLINYQNMTMSGYVKAGILKDKGKDALLIIFKVLMILFIANRISTLASNGYYDFDKFERKSEYDGVSLRNYPYKAADFLQGNDIKGNFFNDFNSGAYLLGRRFPDIKVFIDGRTEVYGPEFYDKYSKIWRGDKALFEEDVKEYNLSAAFLSYVYIPAPAETMRNLYNNKEWKLVYFNYDASIFLRDIPMNKDIISKYEIDLSKWTPPAVDIVKFGAMNFTPYQNYNRAKALYNLKFYDKAEQEIKEALKINPYYPDAYELLANIYVKKNDYYKVFEYARMAKLGDPYRSEARYLMGLSLAQLGDLKQAKEQCRKSLISDPDYKKGKLLLALIYAKEEKLAEMFKILRGFDDPGKVYLDNFFMIADTLIEQENIDGAKKVYEIALKIDPLNKEIKERLERLQHIVY